MGGSSLVNDDITRDALALILVVIYMAMDFLCNTGLLSVQYFLLSKNLLCSAMMGGVNLRSRIFSWSSSSSDVGEATTLVVAAYLGMNSSVPVLYVPGVPSQSQPHDFHFSQLNPLIVRGLKCKKAKMRRFDWWAHRGQGEWAQKNCSRLFGGLSFPSYSMHLVILASMYTYHVICASNGVALKKTA